MELNFVSTKCGSPWLLDLKGCNATQFVSTLRFFATGIVWLRTLEHTNTDLRSTNRFACVFTFAKITIHTQHCCGCTVSHCRRRSHRCRRRCNAVFMVNAKAKADISATCDKWKHNQTRFSSLSTASPAICIEYRFAGSFLFAVVSGTNPDNKIIKRIECHFQHDSQSKQCGIRMQARVLIYLFEIRSRQWLAQQWIMRWDTQQERRRCIYAKDDTESSVASSFAHVRCKHSRPYSTRQWCGSCVQFSC